jgi:serine O-acetyltransferase
MIVPATAHSVEILNEVDLFIDRFRHKMTGQFLLLLEHDLTDICNSLMLDLNARIIQDPACRNSAFALISNAFRVILAYRVSSKIFQKAVLTGLENAKLLAFEMAEFAAAAYSIEISPEAKIGKSFVIDHGINTLIGATTIIGDNCTLLQDVVLGAKKITSNMAGKRHPTIGNNVEIGGGVKIFGPVVIGNSVRIGPGCVVTEDVPDFARVKLVKTIQTIYERKSQT